MVVQDTPSRAMAQAQHNRRKITNTLGAIVLPLCLTNTISYIRNKTQYSLTKVIKYTKLCY